MKPLIWKIFVIFVIVNLAVGQTMPVLAQENTPETPAESETPTPEGEVTESPTESETPTPEGEITETPTTTPSQTVTPTATEIPLTPTETAPVIEIQLHTTPETIKADGKITIHWEVLGIENPNPAFVLQLSLPVNFEVANNQDGNQDGNFDAETRILSTPLSVLSGTFHVQATSEVTEDVFFTLALFDSAQTLLGMNDLLVPIREKFNVNQNGGEITARAGEIKVVFTSGALKNEDIEVEIGTPSSSEVLYSLSGKPFEINAKNTKDSVPLTQFDEEVEFTIDLNAYGIPVEQNDNFFLYWYDPEIKDWAGLYSWTDDETNTLHGVTNHFSVFDVGPNDWESAQVPSVDASQVSTYTGAATYSLPIKLPPGPGGFQPDLNLTYNSQVVDQATTWSSAGWVGMGWSLDTGFIQINTNAQEDLNNLSASIQFNGVSSEIIQTAQGYRLADENFMKIEFGGSYWKVWDKKGNIYEFAYKTRGQLFGCGLYNSRWALTKITNIHGQEINYTYSKETKTYNCPGLGSLTGDTASYPATITYADNRIQVRFLLENRADYNPTHVTDALYHSFQKQRLKEIIVEQDSDDNGSFETFVRKYVLSYHSGTNRIWHGTTRPPSTLASITEYGLSNATFPPVSFTYADAMHLTRADNGYGGAVVYTYDTNPYYYGAARESYEMTWQGTPIPVGSGQAVTMPYSQGGPLKPGGMYFLGAAVYPWQTVQVRLFDGTSSQTSAVGTNYVTATMKLPATAGEGFRGQVYSRPGYSMNVSWTEFNALTTIYRVTSKTLVDGDSTTPDQTYNYTYVGGAVNDAAHSDQVDDDTTYDEKFSEFRGHEKVTITAPDGVTKTIIEYHQTDELKGREIKTTVKVNTTTRSVSQPTYIVTSLSGYTGPAGKTILRTWIEVGESLNQIYNNSGAIVGETKTIYTYDSTYGNQLTKTQQYKSGSSWITKTWQQNYYWPNPTSSRYLVSLIGKTKVYDQYNAVIGTTIYLYDGNTGDHQTMPVNGKLTSVRTLIQNGTDFNQVSYSYDTWGNQTTQTTWTGYATWNTNPTTGIQTTTTVFDSIYHSYPVTVTNSLNQSITMGYDYVKGVPTSIIDLNGNETTATYDNLARITGIKRPGDSNNTLTMSYSPNGSPFQTTITLVPASYSVVRKYDGLGRTVRVTSGGTAIDTKYVSVFETQQTVPYTAGTTPPSQVTKTVISPTTNSTTVTAPDNTFTTTVVNGLTTTVTDAKGYPTSSTTNVWGRTIFVDPPDGPNVGYAYNSMDQLTYVMRGPITLSANPTCFTLPNSSNCPSSTITNFTYDNAGRKKTMTDPDMGYWTYTYDALSNLDTQTDARGCTLDLNYDDLNRLTSKTSNGNGCGTHVSTSYGYDNTLNGNEGIGQRTSMTDASGTTSWLYDIRGRMIKETKVISGQSYATEYHYNSADLIDWMKYPGDGEVVNYTYDSKMLLYSVIGTEDYVTSTTYDIAGRIDSRVLGNGLTQDYAYNSWATQGGRLQSLVTGNTTNTLQNLSYGYDNAGNIESITDSLAGETSEYEYDQLHRLTDWTLTPTSGSPTNETYTYDSNGRLDTKAGVDLQYNDSNHKHAATNAGSNTYTYDANGSQITRVIGSDTFNQIYDAENRLIEVKKNSTTIAQFIFDGDGRRVKSIIGSDTTLFIGGYYEVKNPGASQEITKYYFAGASRIAMRKYTVPVSMELEYFLSDHLGSTSITTDNTGAKVSEMRYKPWGEVRYSWTDTQLTTTPSYTLSAYTFTGQYSYMDDPSTSGVSEGFGLMFYNARWYDPTLGRFAQADTIVPGGVQGLDRYAYVNNSPVMYTDPTGHRCSDGDENTWGYCGDELPAPSSVKIGDRPRYIRDVARKYDIKLSPTDIWGYSNTDTVRLGEYDQREQAPYGLSPNGSRTDDYYNDDNVFIETPDNTVTIFKKTFDECESDDCVAGVLAHEATHSWVEWLIDENSDLPRTDQIPAEEVLADQVALEISPANSIIIGQGLYQDHISRCQSITGTTCSNPAEILADYYEIAEIYNISDLVYGR